MQFEGRYDGNITFFEGRQTFIIIATQLTCNDIKASSVKMPCMMMITITRDLQVCHACAWQWWWRWRWWGSRQRLMSSSPLCSWSWRWWWWSAGWWWSADWWWWWWGRRQQLMLTSPRCSWSCRKHEFYEPVFVWSSDKLLAPTGAQYSDEVLVYIQRPLFEILSINAFL